MTKKINQVIINASLYIKKKHDKYNLFNFNSIFPTIIICEALSHSNQVELSKNLAKQIFQQEFSPLSFNYLSKQREKITTKTYPDDLEETFFALAAVFNSYPQLITSKILAQATNLLVNCESQEGGPYNTWTSNPIHKKRGDVDLGVNVNIGYFLSLQDITLPNIVKLVENSIKSNKLCSPYYIGEIPLIYFISRWYQGEYKYKLIEKLNQYLQKETTSLELSLIISSLLRFGASPKTLTKSVKKLLDQQNKSYSWPKSNLYIENKETNKKIGSSSITTAIAIEALSLFLTKSKKNKDINKSPNKKNQNNNYSKEIYKLAQKQFLNLSTAVKKEINLIFTKLKKESLEELIIYTPLYITKSLKSTYSQIISKNLITQLSLVNLYGWAAYTIYDDIIDQDASIDKIMIANILCREMDIIFNNLKIKNKVGFYSLYKDTMQKIECANFWELNNCRFSPDQYPQVIPPYKYKYLADRSMGHALSSIAILCQLGFDTNTEQAKNLLEFFKHFLIARQMNDDAHDWLEDLKKGQINSAASNTLKVLMKNNSKNVILNQENEKKLQIIFWEETASDYFQSITTNIDLAKKHLRQIDLFDSFAMFEQMISSVSVPTNKAIKQRNQTINFFKTYYHKS